MNKHILAGSGPTAILIPVAEELVAAGRSEQNAILGMFCRQSSVMFEQNRIEHGSSMVLWVVPGISVLHWMVRVIPIKRAGGTGQPSGSLRLVANPSQPGAMQCGLSSTSTSQHVDLNELGEPDRYGGWTVGGHVGLSVPVEGLLGVRLQAIAQNTRILWSAISQAHRE